MSILHGMNRAHPFARAILFFAIALIGFTFSFLSLFCAGSEKGTVAIGSRIEMFVDDWLIDTNRTRGSVSLQLQTPVRREVVLVTDKPWEGPDSAYYTVFQDGPLVRLYYRGLVPGGDRSTEQVTCYAESSDGIHFTRTNLGLVDFNVSKVN